MAGCRSPGRGASLVAVLLMGFCPSAHADPRRPDIWVAYNGLYHRESFEVDGNRVLQNEDDGGIPEFAVRLPAATAGARHGPGTLPSADRQAAEIAPDFLVNPAAARGGRLLLAISELSLPLVRTSSEGHDVAVRYVAIDVDLLADRFSAAASLCRGLEPQAVPAATGDRCRIEVTIDASDNWPVEATISRTLSAANRTQSTYSITLRRRISDRQSESAPARNSNRR